MAIKLGTVGNNVISLQKKLGITADGVYGPQTQNAVKAYQQNNGLTVDGVAGDETLTHMFTDNGVTPRSAGPLKTTPGITKYAYHPMGHDDIDRDQVWTPPPAPVYSESDLSGEPTQQEPTQNTWKKPVPQTNNVATKPVTTTVPVTAQTYAAPQTNTSVTQPVTTTQQPTQQQAAPQTPDYTKQAEAIVNPQYNSEKEALTQKANNIILGLQQAKAGLDSAYKTREERIKEAYKLAKDDIGNQALARGFGRSTYVQDKLAQSDTNQTKDIGDTEAELTSAKSNYDAQITQYQQQLNESIARLDTDKALKIAENIRSLQEKATADAWNRVNATGYVDAESSKILGIPEGTSTLQAKQYAQDNARADAQITGEYNGKPTLQAQQAEKDNARADAALTGEYNGQQTIQAQQQAITNAWNRVNTIGSVDAESSKVLGIPVGTKTQEAVSLYAQMTGKMPDGKLTLAAQQYADEQKQQAIAKAWDSVNAFGYVTPEASKILGIPAGTQTQAAKQQSIANAWAATETMGYVTSAASKVLGLPAGTKTEAAKEALFNQGINVGQLTGTYNNKPTMANKQLDASIANDKTQNAISQQNANTASKNADTSAKNAQTNADKATQKTSQSKEKPPTTSEAESSAYNTADGLKSQGGTKLQDWFNTYKSQLRTAMGVPKYNAFVSYYGLDE